MEEEIMTAINQPQLYGQPQWYGQSHAFVQNQPQNTIRPETQQWFQTVDRDRSGQIQWQELQAALVNAQGEHFSANSCQMMISMFDIEQKGSIGIYAFQLLYEYINQWLTVFRNYDKNRSGSIEENELTEAFQQMGYRFSPSFIKFLITKSDLTTHSKISVDQFILICIQIQKFTEAFRAKDTQLKGIITIGFEESLKLALTCSP